MKYFKIPHPFSVTTNVAHCGEAPRYVTSKVRYALESWDNTFGGRKVFNLVDENGCQISPKRHLEIKNTYLELFKIYSEGKLEEIPAPF